MFENPYAPPPEALDEEEGVPAFRRKAASAWWLATIACKGLAAFALAQVTWGAWLWVGLAAAGLTNWWLSQPMEDRLGMLYGPPVVPACALAGYVMRAAWRGEYSQRLRRILIGLLAAFLLGSALLVLTIGRT